MTQLLLEFPNGFSNHFLLDFPISAIFILDKNRFLLPWNKSYSYYRYWTGTSFQWRHIRGISLKRDML